MVRLVARILVTVAAVALGREEPRPNLDEWKAKQADDAASAHAVAAAEKKTAAVGKAVELLESLHAKVMAEGEAEAKTYEKFACFCKDTAAEKVDGIQKGEDSKAELTATINELSTKRDTHDTKIQTAQDAIENHEKEQAISDEERKAGKQLYDSNAADMQAALDALTGAIKTLKSSKKPSFAQLSTVSETLRAATALADALGVSGAATAMQHAVALLQMHQPANEVQMQDYDFHSDGIISTLEKLQEEFRSTKVKVDEEEVEAIRVHQNFTQVKTHALKMENERIAKEKKAREDTIADIESNSQELATVEATLLEDKEYTNKLSQMCSDKAKTWDQRSDVRAAEISTLTQAIGIIKGAVSEKTSAATIRFAQQGASVRFAQAVASDSNAMEAIEAAAEEADAGGLSFVQRAATPWTPSRGARTLRGAFLATANLHMQRPEDREERDGKEAVVEMLRTQGRQLRSTLLASLASKIAADPFAKVKTLIQELIERLLQEAANEANHKGWCDKAMSDAKQKRDYAAEEIEGLNSEMAKFEARRDVLAEALNELATDIKELEDSRQQAVDERSQEKAQNEATIAEAEEGLKALNMCIELLDRFYKTIKKGKVDLSLAQANPADEAPDAGFDNGEAYLGAQSENGGILGMLDVMKSDFVRTVEETQLAEEQAERDHLEFMTETGKSLAQKEEAETQRKAQKEDTETKLGEAETSLDSESGKLTTALSEFLELKPVCIDTGMSYEDRVALREEEIEALKRADCILGRYAEYGPEGAADGC